MNNSSSSPTFDDRDEYPQVTQADLDRATFRVGLKPVPRKQRITILLDTGLIEYFKAKAGERGYQTLINDTLRQAMERENLEETLRGSFVKNCNAISAKEAPNLQEVQRGGVYHRIM